LPLNLLLQFSKAANLYFIILLFMELIPQITDSNGPIPGLALPLSFVVGLSMIKDIYEDIKRHISDNEENNRIAKVVQRIKKHNQQFQQFLSRRWQQIRVGEIVKVLENEYFPCDLLLLNSSLPKGVCYVETKNLDGETNLKHKQAHREIRNLALNDKDILFNFNKGEIECEKENEFLYKFNG
jgi:phospholipid-transporting ATPase